MDKQQIKTEILKRIEKPVIPPVEYDINQFGIMAESEEIQTFRIQAAIDKISELGGGKLVFPKGRYLTGALRLKDKVELHLESEETVFSFVAEGSFEHYPLVFTHWEASPCYNFSPLIYACEAKDIAITGKGVLDGGADAEHWWNWHHQVENAWSDDRPDLQLDDRRALRNMNLSGVAVSERIFGEGHYLRPNFIQPIRCERVLFEGFTVKNSPMWLINPVMCRSITIDGVTLSSYGANNDGCDPESCNGVYICNCRFDTGDDCISLKSGRDRDGRTANIPCENIVIEHNDFAGGHGGIAMGSEMSGGIKRVVAVDNHFSSEQLTYALRFKTNAKRGGIVEDIVLADSVIDKVNGAAVHGTMLYEDGRNGEFIPVFRNIVIENVTAHGGDYGIFLEAFDEVPITGLTLKNINIDGVAQPFRSMNWKDPVIENVVINQKRFPRPSMVRILGVPRENAAVCACSAGSSGCEYCWQVSFDAKNWQKAYNGEQFVVPEGAVYVKLIATDKDGNCEQSREYAVLDKSSEHLAESWQRLLCRNMLSKADDISGKEFITRKALARMLIPLAKVSAADDSDNAVMQMAVANGFLALKNKVDFAPGENVTRQEMATVAMQACGVNYRNASSTTPICADSNEVNQIYATNAARSLYFKFMSLDEENRFNPNALVTIDEAIDILARVADFAGI